MTVKKGQTIGAHHGAKDIPMIGEWSPQEVSVNMASHVNNSQC